MDDLSILSVAYQRRDAGDARELSAIIAEIKADLKAMQPPAPGPGDVIGRKVENIGGTCREYEIRGDGSMVEVAS